jgi:hypothetical protein
MPWSVNDNDPELHNITEIIDLGEEVLIVLSKDVTITLTKAKAQSLNMLFRSLDDHWKDQQND